MYPTQPFRFPARGKRQGWHCNTASSTTGNLKGSQHLTVAARRIPVMVLRGTQFRFLSKFISLCLPTTWGLYVPTQNIATARDPIKTTILKRTGIIITPELEHVMQAAAVIKINYDNWLAMSDGTRWRQILKPLCTTVPAQLDEAL